EAEMGRGSDAGVRVDRVLVGELEDRPAPAARRVDSPGPRRMPDCGPDHEAGCEQQRPEGVESIGNGPDPPVTTGLDLTKNELWRLPPPVAPVANARRQPANPVPNRRRACLEPMHSRDMRAEKGRTTAVRRMALY